MEVLIMNDYERPNLKQMRIKMSVCARLDERKSKDDSYTDVIKAVLDENEMLKARIRELKQDKQDLVEIAKGFKSTLNEQPVYVKDNTSVEPLKKEMQDIQDNSTS